MNEELVSLLQAKLLQVEYLDGQIALTLQVPPVDASCIFRLCLENEFVRDLAAKLPVDSSAQDDS